MPWGLREPILMWLVAELVPTLAILIDMGSSRVAGIEGRRFLTGGYELVYELVGDAATLVFAHLALRRLGADWRSFGFTSFDAGKAARSIAAGWIGMALAVRLLFGFLRVLLPGFDPEQPYIPEIDDALKVGAWEGVLALSSVLVAAPLTEEVLFRGFLFTALLRHGAGQAALYSSLAFALLHFQPNAMVNAFVLGAVACALYWRLGSLWPAVAFHALCNLGAVSE